MLRVDFHSHTRYSPDSITPIKKLISAARNRGLDRLVVTDHNSIQGALEAQAAAPDLIIVGEEILTTQGELLASFVTQEVPRGLEPMVALARLKDQGAFISISHPFDPRRSGWTLETLEQLATLVDAIETCNARVFSPDYNTRAEEFATQHHLPGTAGSDGHHPSEIGRVYSLVPEFTDAESLRSAIVNAQNCGRPSCPAVHLYSAWARIVKSVEK